MTRIVLVRHGQTTLNRGDRIRGQLDPPLDEHGLRQAQQTASYLASAWPVTAVYASPLQRAMQTGDAIARAQGLDVVAFDGLLDLDFGEWHGLSYSEAQKSYPAIHWAWSHEPHTVCFPGGESLGDVRERAMRGIRVVASRHPGQMVAMVGHTVVNRVILCATLGVSNEVFWRFGQDTCAVNVIGVPEDGTMMLHLMNDTSHLRDE